MELSEIFSGPMTPAKWRALGEHLQNGTVRGGPGLRVRQVGRHTILSAKRRFPVGGASDSCTAFKLAQGAENNELTVTESTILGETPADFTEGKKTFTIARESGVIYGKIAISSAGAPTDAEVLEAAEIPDDSDEVFHREIGRYIVEGTGEDAVIRFTQTKCGPLDATVCRNWFTSEAPYYGLTWL